MANLSNGSSLSLKRSVLYSKDAFCLPEELFSQWKSPYKHHITLSKYKKPYDTCMNRLYELHIRTLMTSSKQTYLLIFFVCCKSVEGAREFDSTRFIYTSWLIPKLFSRGYRCMLHTSGTGSVSRPARFAWTFSHRYPCENCIIW